MTDLRDSNHSSEPELGEALRADHPPPRFPASEIEDRIRARLGSQRPSAVRELPREAERPADALRRWRAIAAALALFLGGTLAGYSLAVLGPRATNVERETATLPILAETLPMAIQSRGSDYVASLAAFSSASAQLTAEEREVAREVALAALYGAAAELLAEASDDDALMQSIAELVATRWEQTETGRRNDPIGQ